MFYKTENYLLKGLLKTLMLEKINLRSFCSLSFFYPISLFFFATLFMSFFTIGVPFFWDDHQFNQHFLAYPASQWVGEIFGVNILNPFLMETRAMYALLVKVLFAVVGYSFFYYRITKAMIFGVYIMCFYFLSVRFIKNKNFSFFLSFLPLCSFPFYSHILYFDEPFIIMEMFKLAAFVLFFFWYEKYTQRTTSFFTITLLISCFFAFLAMRTYASGYSILGIVPLFLIFTQWKRITQSPLLLGIIIFFGGIILFIIYKNHISFPFPLTSINLQRVFLRGWGETIITPFIHLDTLYYKPFSAVITFFGVWLIIITALAVILKYIFKNLFSQIFISEYKGYSEYSMFILFISAWIICELPIWIVLPEHAIRYSSSLIAPFTILAGIFIYVAYSSLAPKLKSITALILLFFLFFICLTNITYILAFRIGWGSSFIATDSAAHFLAKNSPPHTVALYYTLSAGDEYLILTEEPGNYTIRQDPLFIKKQDLLSFEKTSLEELQATYDTVFIMQRISAQKNSAYPPLSFEQQEYLKPIQTILGLGNNPFDWVYTTFFQLEGKDPPTTTVTIYTFTPSLAKNDIIQ